MEEPISDSKDGMSHELCILFLHHKDDAVTRKHFGLIRKFNPGIPIVPLTFENGIPGSIRIRPSHWNISNQWAAPDTLIYGWFAERQIDAARYVALEYDTFCSQPVKEFYREVWYQDVACSEPITDKNADWHWFKSKPVVRRKHLFGDNLAGMVPTCGCFFSHKALSDMTKRAEDGIYFDIISECRLGTVARTCGYAIHQIRPDSTEFISWQKRTPSKPGIWHAVKSAEFELPE